MSAVISNCGKYRYRLTRTVNPNNNKGAVAFLMLNPSTADSSLDDPTIRRCKAFANSWGYRELVVVNLYALRSTDPKALLTSANPVGEINKLHLVETALNHDFVVCAWGCNAQPDHAEDMAKLFRVLGCKLMCLGVTRSGSPRHPLYVKGDTPLVEWQGGAL